MRSPEMTWVVATIFKLLLNHLLCKSCTNLKTINSNRLIGDSGLTGITPNKFSGLLSEGPIGNLATEDEAKFVIPIVYTDSPSFFSAYTTSWVSLSAKFQRSRHLYQAVRQHVRSRPIGQIGAVNS